MTLDFREILIVYCIWLVVEVFVMDWSAMFPNQTVRFHAVVVSIPTKIR